MATKVTEKPVLVPVVLFQDPESDEECIILPHETASLSIPEGIFLKCAKEKIETIVINRSPYVFYSGCSKEQQDNFTLLAKEYITGEFFPEDFDLNDIILSLYDKTKSCVERMFTLAEVETESEKAQQFRAQQLMTQLQQKQISLQIFTATQMRLLLAFADQIPLEPSKLETT